jgi:superfamily II DNA or RNA helicase
LLGESLKLVKSKVTKKNEVYLTVEAEPSTARSLSDFFTFEVPGARFMPAYRNRIWDGKIRLYSPANGELYMGLLPYLEKWLEDYDEPYEISEELKDEKQIDRPILDGFIRQLNLRARGKSIKPRDYQVDAVEHAIRNHRALLLSPTASGKSLIIYILVRYYTLRLIDELNDKILILVPTTSLVEQMASDFIDYGWQEAHIQKVYSGHDKNVTKDVVISTWQSLYKMPTSYFNQFGMVVGDEAHLFKAKSLTSILTKMHQCKYRFGLTGTLDGMQTHRLVLEGLFGTLNKVVTTKKLIDEKTLSDFNIKALVLTYPETECKLVKGMSYQDEMDYIVSHTARNEFIRDLTLRLKSNTLVLFQYVEKHGKVLHEMISEETDRKVFFVYGGTDTQTREDIRAITEQEKDAIIIASYGTFSTGINIRNLHNIVFSSPSKSRVRALQSIGRGLRRSESKDTATLFDIADDFTYKSKKNFTINHFLERINIYNEEQFDYQIQRIKMK